MKLVLNLNNFTYKHDMVVIDDNGSIIHTYTTNMDDVAYDAAAFAADFKVDKIMIKGAPEFVNKVIDQIKGLSSDYSLKDNLEFEIV